MKYFKKIIYKIFGENIGKQVKRIINFILSKKKKINSKVHLDIITNGYHSFCGYYDFDPVQNSKMLFLSTDSQMDVATVSVYNFLNKKITDLDIGQSVNWQQGNRLRWFGKNRFIFNSFEEGEYNSVEFENEERKTHVKPIYDVNNKGQAISLDFNRLGWLRPGYGYTRFPLRKIDVTESAITIFSLENDKVIKEITYEELIQAYCGEVDLQNCYVNHLCFSPSGDSFLFFFIEIKNGIHQCNLGIYDGAQIKFLEKELSASHYTWKNDNTILATLYDKDRNCGYYLYDLKNNVRTQIMPDKLTHDGHPTYINNNCIVTDTYPDKAGFQKILLVDLLHESIKECVSIYSTARHVGVERCDLHPRFAKEVKKIIFDADINGHRKIYSFDIGDVKQ